MTKAWQKLERTKQWVYKTIQFRQTCLHDYFKGNTSTCEICNQRMVFDNTLWRDLPLDLVRLILSFARPTYLYTNELKKTIQCYNNDKDKCRIRDLSMDRLGDFLPDNSFVTDSFYIWIMVHLYFYNHHYDKYKPKLFCPDTCEKLKEDYDYYNFFQLLNFDPVDMDDLDWAWI